MVAAPQSVMSQSLPMCRNTLSREEGDRMEDKKAAEQVAVAHAIKHGFYDCNIVSTTELGSGLSKVIVRGKFSWPTEEHNPEDAAEVALFI